MKLLSGVTISQRTELKLTACRKIVREEGEVFRARNDFLSGVRNHQESEFITSRISTKSYVCLSHNQYLVELVLKATHVVGIPMLSNAR
jgi:hypothetical protein